MAEELKELEELKNFEEAPPLWGWYLNIFPTQHIQVLGWVFSHRKGARLSDIRVSLAMELLESGGSIGVEIVFWGRQVSPGRLAVFGCNLRWGGRPLFAPGGVFSLLDFLNRLCYNSEYGKIKPDSE